MGHSREVVGAIAGFRPEGQSSPFARTDLGTVTTDKGDEFRVVHGPFQYRTRFIGDPEQPLLDRWTIQPVVALEGEKGVFPLPYAADVKRLPEGLVEQIADRLGVPTK